MFMLISHCQWDIHELERNALVYVSTFQLLSLLYFCAQNESAIASHFQIDYKKVVEPNAVHY